MLTCYVLSSLNCFPTYFYLFCYPYTLIVTFFITGLCHCTLVLLEKLTDSHLLDHEPCNGDYVYWWSHDHFMNMHTKNGIPDKAILQSILRALCGIT